MCIGGLNDPTTDSSTPESLLGVEDVNEAAGADFDTTLGVGLGLGRGSNPTKSLQ